MGNKLALDVNEAVINCLYLLPGEENPISSESKYIKSGTMSIQDKRIKTLKIRLADLTDILSKKTDDHVALQKLSSLLVDQSAENVEVMVTGYGFDVYSERLQGFLDSFVKNSTFKKLKQIKYYGIALNFLVNSTKDMFYKLNPTEITKLNQEINESNGINLQKEYVNEKELQEPFMVVNIKSGVSYYKIDPDGSAQRLSGSLIGESTYSSLIKLLTNYSSLDESVEDSITGDNRSVDMTVGDIYGGGYDSFSLSKDIIASSFGKARYTAHKDLEPKDIARSILTMISINISQLSAMVSDVEKMDRVVILGGMFSQEVFQQIFASFFSYWTRGRKAAIYTQNSDFLAPLGMLLVEGGFKE